MKRTFSRLTLLAVGALAAISSNVFAANSIIQHSSNTGNNYVAYYDLKTATAAQSYCAAHGGHLAVLNNHSETVDVIKLVTLNSTDNYWLGASIAANTAARATVTGQAFYTDPNYVFNDMMGTDGAGMNDNYADNLFMNGNGDGSLYWGYVADLHYFICEFEDAPY